MLRTLQTTNYLLMAMVTGIFTACGFALTFDLLFADTLVHALYAFMITITLGIISLLTGRKVIESP